MISDSVLLYYYTHMIGDGNDLPVIKGMASFDAIGLFVSELSSQLEMTAADANLFLRLAGL
jgi:hypothetical protein